MRGRRKKFKRIADILFEISVITGLMSLLVIFTEAPAFIRITGWVSVFATCLFLGIALYIKDKILN